MTITEKTEQVKGVQYRTKPQYNAFFPYAQPPIALLNSSNLHVYWASALRSGTEMRTESSSALALSSQTLLKSPALLSAQASGHLKYWHNGARSEWLFTTRARSPFFHLAFAFFLRPICALYLDLTVNARATVLRRVLLWQSQPPPWLALIQGPFQIRGQGTYYSRAALFRRTCINSRKEWECYVHNGIWKAFRFFCSHCLSILF